jgi:hypothetical protein
MHLQETKKFGADWIHPVEDRNYWQVVANTVMDKHYLLACIKI